MIRAAENVERKLTISDITLDGLTTACTLHLEKWYYGVTIGPYILCS